MSLSYGKWLAAIAVMLILVGGEVMVIGMKCAATVMNKASGGNQQQLDLGLPERYRVW